MKTFKSLSYTKWIVQATELITRDYIETLVGTKSRVGSEHIEFHLIWSAWVYPVVATLCECLANWKISSTAWPRALRACRPQSWKYRSSAKRAQRSAKSSPSARMCSAVQCGTTGHWSRDPIPSTWEAFWKPQDQDDQGTRPMLIGCCF